METDQSTPNTNSQTLGSQVSNASQPVQSSSSPLSQQTLIVPNKKFPKWIIVSLIILLLGTSLIFAFKYYQLKQQIDHNQPTPYQVEKQSELSNNHSDKLATSSSAKSLTINLNDFPNKELLGENETYSVFLINPIIEEKTLKKNGEIIVNNKTNNNVIKIDGQFSIFGTVIPINDNNEKYLLLSLGTHVSRQIIPLSLTERKQITDNFCSTGGKIFFWNDFVVFDNCDAFDNRPWGAGQAPSVEAINLKTSEKKVISKSNLVKHYSVEKIDQNTLYYTKIHVDNESNWNNPDLQKIEPVNYDLTLLLN